MADSNLFLKCHRINIIPALFGKCIWFSLFFSSCFCSNRIFPRLFRSSFFFFHFCSFSLFAFGLSPIYNQRQRYISQQAHNISQWLTFTSSFYHESCFSSFIIIIIFGLEFCAFISKRITSRHYRNTETNTTHIYLYFYLHFHFKMDALT